METKVFMKQSEKHFKRESRLFYMVQIFIDLLMVNVGYYLAFYFRYGGITEHIETYYQTVIYISIFTVFFEYVFGIYRCGEVEYIETLLSTGIMLIFIQVSAMAISFFTRTFAFPRSVFFVALIVQMILFVIYKFITYQLYLRVYPKKTMLVIDKEESAIQLVHKIMVSNQNQYEVKHILTKIDHTTDLELLKSADVICLGAQLSSQERELIMSFCVEYDKMAYVVPNLFDISIYKAQFKQFDDMPVFQIQNYHLNIEERVMKRALDIFCSILGIFVFLPIMLLVAVLIKIQDGGPALFRQERLTYSEKAFHVLKFRTMVIDAERHSGPVLAQDKDPRITWLGKILRATRFDELPQLFNVLLGDMSLVGPRPERQHFISQYEKDLPHFRYRLNVKAGLTGLAQVLGKYTTEPNDKLRYDLIYIRDYSFFLDIKIIVQTIKTMLMKVSAKGTVEISDEEKASQLIKMKVKIL